MSEEGITAENIPPHRFFIAARKALGWSQGALAENAGVSKSKIADFERGKRKMMHNNFRAICRAFGRAGVDFALDEADQIIGVRWPA